MTTRPLVCACCRIDFHENGDAMYAPLENRSGFAVCDLCGGSYGDYELLRSRTVRPLVYADTAKGGES
jgi:hypothetical protein